jgi:hypothetical protein
MTPALALFEGCLESAAGVNVPLFRSALPAYRYSSALSFPLSDAERVAIAPETIWKGVCAFTDWLTLPWRVLWLADDSASLQLEFDEFAARGVLDAARFQSNVNQIRLAGCALTRGMNAGAGRAPMVVRYETELSPSAPVRLRAGPSRGLPAQLPKKRWTQNGVSQECLA